MPAPVALLLRSEELASKKAAVLLVTTNHLAFGLT